MNNFNHYRRIVANKNGLISNISSGSNRSRVALAIYVIAMLVTGGLLFYNYPLEATILILFIGSVLLMDKR